MIGWPGTPFVNVGSVLTHPRRRCLVILPTFNERANLAGVVAGIREAGHDVLVVDDNLDAGIAHFRAKITADPDGPDTFAAEVLVRLLVRKGREKEAMELGKQYLALADERQMNCPGPMELAQRVKDYGAVAELAKMRDDPVHYLAGLIAQK